MSTVMKCQGILEEIRESSGFWKHYTIGNTGHSKYRIRVGNAWLPEMSVETGLSQVLCQQVGKNVTVMTLNRHLVAVEIDGRAFGTDMGVGALERGIVLVFSTLLLALLLAFISSRNPALLFPAVAIFLMVRVLWRCLAVKDAALKVPNVTIDTSYRPAAGNH